MLVAALATAVAALLHSLALDRRLQALTLEELLLLPMLLALPWMSATMAPDLPDGDQAGAELSVEGDAAPRDELRERIDDLYHALRRWALDQDD